MPNLANRTYFPSKETILYELLKQTQDGHARRFICCVREPESGYFSLICTELLYFVSAPLVGPLPCREVERFLLSDDLEARAAEVLQQHIDLSWTQTR